MFYKSKLSITANFVSGIIALFYVSAGHAGNIDVSRGKYLIEIGGCNDCHTSGYAPSGGATPEAEWSLGDSLGFRGGWGTTYAINLRKNVDNISENEWISKTRTLKTRPPMPWWALNAMTAQDLSEIYKYIKSLEVIDNSIPAYLPPGAEPETPYIQWPSMPG